MEKAISEDTYSEKEFSQALLLNLWLMNENSKNKIQGEVKQ